MGNYRHSCLEATGNPGCGCGRCPRSERTYDYKFEPKSCSDRIHSDASQDPHYLDLKMPILNPDRVNRPDLYHKTILEAYGTPTAMEYCLESCDQREECTHVNLSNIRKDAQGDTRAHCYLYTKSQFDDSK